MDTARRRRRAYAPSRGVRLGPQRTPFIPAPITVSNALVHAERRPPSRMIGPPRRCSPWTGAPNKNAGITMKTQPDTLCTEHSDACFERACRVLVGGVNSPVRAFRAVGGRPVFLASAGGAHVTDVDGNRYVDLVGSWGPAIVGHAHPAVVEAVQHAAADGLSFGACCPRETDLAEVIVGALPSVEMIRFVNSGTEATMSAVRLARAATGRSRIVKFEGCYHGHVDALLVAAGSGASTFGVPDSAGIPAEVAQQTILAPYNDLAAVERIMAEHGDDVAAILVEPAAGNMGYVPPVEGFLEGLRAACDRAGSLLVFDEVMTGFRVAWGGYQVRCDVRPDLTCLGKVIGGGMPVAAYGGRRDLMEQVSPLGPAYQAGTLSGNPLGMAAGFATLTLCGRPGFYDTLHERTTRLADGLKAAAVNAGVPVTTGAVGGMLGLAFSEKPIRDFDDAKACDHECFARFFHAMLERGVWLPPSSYEAMFVSSAHDDATIGVILDAASESFAAARA
ncbi:MAG: glutamate-1-semialdehyde 2,1-aminomutase [Planctomycetes bacterium]|nr:glutamate-1-semialdehyde 2,1-aminomutase [Planctomycetota bacterium]